MTIRVNNSDDKNAVPTNHILFMSIYTLLITTCLLLLISACSELAPVNEPAQLNATSGAPITITNEFYETEAFRLQYPDGWRVITSASELPPSVIFASPNEQTLIVISTEPIENIPQPIIVEGELATDGEVVFTQNDQAIYTAFITPESAYSDTETLFRRVISTIE